MPPDNLNPEHPCHQIQRRAPSSRDISKPSNKLLATQNYQTCSHSSQISLIQKVYSHSHKRYSNCIPLAKQSLESSDTEIDPSEGLLPRNHRSYIQTALRTHQSLHSTHQIFRRQNGHGYSLGRQQTQLWQKTALVGLGNPLPT